MSVPCLIDNLLHAAVLDGALLGAGCVCTLPALSVSMAELAQAVGAEYAVDANPQVRWGADEALAANFGRYPALCTARADAAGFRHDGNARALVRSALA